MTKNQIEYAKLMEARRANLINENYRLQELAELKRHSLVTESEAYRHNTASEGLGWGQLNESMTHNRNVEQQAINELTERNRAAVAQESLKASEVLSSNQYRSDQIENKKAEIALGYTKLGYDLAETGLGIFSNILSTGLKLAGGK